MKYLCLETSGKGGFFAVFSGRKKEIDFIWSEGFLSENLSVQLSKLMPYFKNSKVQMVAVSAGPGRFTGLRAGVNLAKTLAYYLKCPVYPCSSLRLAAEPYLNQGPVLCVREAFGNMVYVGAWEKLKNAAKVLIPPRAVFLNNFEEQIRQLRVKIKKDFICAVDADDKKTASLIKNGSLQQVKRFSIFSESFSSVILDGNVHSGLKPWFEVEPLYLRSPGLLKRNLSRLKSC